jgi:signal transduction histidine kinase
VVTFTALSIISLINNGPYTIDKILQNSNSIYVQVNKFITRKNESGQQYLASLGRQYDINAAITSPSGKIIYSTDNVETATLDIDSIRNKLINSYGGGDFYQLYNISLDGELYYLVVWRIPEGNFNIGVLMLILILPTVLGISIIYLVIRFKAAYIKEIFAGINVISRGNLDYRIREKGYDEISLLAAKINNMSSELKQKIEEERISENLKHELITNVSHDLRTPLTSLIAYLMLIYSANTSEEDKKKYLRVCLEKAEGLKILINDLFEYSKLESKDIKINKESVNIVELIEQALGEFIILARNKNMSFKKEFEIERLNLEVDPFLMSRAVGNLISNAIKYGKEDTEIIVGIRNINNNAEISINNRTESYDKLETARVFERFYTIDKARNSENSGSGLGLAITKSIIELHNGSIEVHVVEDTFSIIMRMAS